MAELPPCSFYIKGKCSESRPLFVNETDDSYLFMCDACKNFYGFSKDFVKRKASYQNEVNTLKHEAQVRNAVSRKAVYSR